MNGADDPIRKNHPEWLLEYSSSFILDPGNPEVIEYLVKVIKDIVIKYNVDGIVFDDYFYPYEGTKNEDAYSQSLYKPEGKNVGDWRRENCNKLIADIYAMIQETKPTVKFGIGPFGIWGGSSSVFVWYRVFEYKRRNECLFPTILRWSGLVESENDRLYFATMLLAEFQHSCLGV